MRSGRFLALTLLVVGTLFAASCSKSEPSKPSVQGEWHGSIEVPGNPLPVGITFTAEDKATIDIPAQGMQGVALKDVRTEPDRVEFAIANVPGDPVFHGKLDAQRITGKFTQAGVDFTLNMERGALARQTRPQDPKPPYPYKSTDVTYRNGELTIAGTLTEPQGAGPFPAVLLLVGSGANNRDEEIAGHRPLLVLADALTRSGYAVLRTDQRGVGGTGSKLADATYRDLADDAVAGLRFLRSRSEIDPARVGLMGHSQGGYIGPLVASRPDANVAFVISMAGPAVLGAEVVAEQARLIGAAEGMPAEQIDEQVRANAELAKLLLAGDLEGARALVKQQNAELPPDKRQPDDKIAAAISINDMALYSYDPAPALKALRIPVLAFFGGKDLQVPPAQNEKPMRENLAADPDATVHVFPNLNHLMQPADKGAPSEYKKIDVTIDPEVLTFVTGWLQQRFPTK
ncbi:alpha/beta fold hydrolase [Nocardia panacis]|uniref:Alpha/beta fold hydrolase n=1 Tax=Nocardia panacis TaxID=2340916 RepID=A0A3A4KJZ8_9NOCA|nr:alpha/beta fold hydrolase [Nocardia panacis]RJO75001.1 alpha/beta fold hydrolase [Nocardia panacis]